MYVIFRRSDALYVGTSSPPSDLEVEIANITSSELGGVASDYTAVEIDQFSHLMLPVLELDGSVAFVEKPKLAARRAVEARAKAGLAALGLDADVVNRIVR